MVVGSYPENGECRICKLLPLSYRECVEHGENLSPDSFMLKGGYPHLHVAKIPPVVFFENLVVAETLKRHTNAGRNPELFFYCDDSKIEVDLIDATDCSASELIEIKSTTTFKADLARHLESVGDDLNMPEKGRGVVMRSDASHTVNGIKFWSAQDWLMR